MGLGKRSATRNRRSWIEGGVEGIGGEEVEGSAPLGGASKGRMSRRPRWASEDGGQRARRPRWALSWRGSRTPSGGAEGSRPAAGVGVGVGVDGEGSRVEGVRGVPMRITEVEGRRGLYRCLGV
jgi:hypothetical protein